MLEITAALVLSYVVGAIPTSYLTARAKGVDLRQYGSGNLGATNLYRALGWKYAAPAGIFDIAKGAVAVLVLAPLGNASTVFGLVCGIAAVLGHMFSPFIRFKGGKGVATGAGVVLGIAPLAFGVALVVWALLVAATGYVSLGSIVAAASYPIAVYVLHSARRDTIWIDIGLAALIIWMHRANIGRLVHGTENRFGRRSSPQGQATPPS